MTVPTGNDYIVTVGGVVKDITGRLEALERVGVNSDIIVMPDGSLENPGDYGIGDGSVAVYVQADPPTGLNQSTDVGNIWYETDNNNAAHWWDGFSWLPYGPGSPIYDGALGLGALGPSIVSRNLTHFTAYTGGTAPSSPNFGDLWRDINNSNQVNHWNGSSWDVVDDGVIINDLSAAFTNADISDGHLNVYYLADPPVGLNGTTDKGDLWYDTDAHYSPHTWDGNGWIDWTTQEEQVGTSDGIPPPYSPTPSVHGGIGTLFVEWIEVPNADPVSYYIYVSPTTPVATDSTTYVGNTAGSTAFVIHALQDGTALDPANTYHVAVIARDADGPAPVSGEASGSPLYMSVDQLEQTVQDKLNGIGSNGASKVYWQDTPPTGNSYAVGDTWFETDNGYAIYEWNGSAWIPTQLGSAAIANGAITSTQLSSGVNSSITTANNKNQMYFQTSAPTGGTYRTNDIWFDTDNGYAPYYWNGTAWTPYTFGTGALAASAVTTTQLASGAVDASKILSGTITETQLSSGLNTKINSAGGSHIYYQATAPTGGTYATNDVWFNTSAGNEPYYWNGSAWTAFQYGTGAIAAGSITATQIASQTITAGNIAAGTITAAQIATDTITANQISAGAIGASELAANSVVAGKIAANAVTSSTIAAGAITAGKIAAGAITTEALSVGAIQGNMVPNGTFSDGVGVDGIPYGWHVAGGTGTTAVSLVADANSSNGDNVMAIGPAGANAGQYVLCTAFPITAGKGYSLHISAKHSDGTGMCYMYVVTNSTQPAGGYSTTPNVADGETASATTSAGFLAGGTYHNLGTWIDGAINLDIDGAGTTASWAWVYIQNYNSTGTLYVSAVEVQEQSDSVMIADGAITANKIQAGAVIAGKIAAGTITSNEIAANTITGANIYAGTITAVNIAAGTITGDKLYANTITGDKIAGSTITGANIAGGTITGDKISATAINGKTITSNTINSATINSSSIYSAYINSPNIYGGTIQSTNLYTTNIYGTFIQTQTSGRYIEMGNTGVNDTVDEIRFFNYGTVSSIRNYSSYPGTIFFSMQGGSGGNGNAVIWPRDYNNNIYMGQLYGGAVKFLSGTATVQSRSSYDGGYGNFIATAFNTTSSTKFKRNIRTAAVTNHKTILKGAAFKKWNRPYADLGIPQIQAADPLDFAPAIEDGTISETIEERRARGEQVRAQLIATATAEADSDHYGLVLEDLPSFLHADDESYSLNAVVAFLWDAASNLHDRIDALEARLPRPPVPPTPGA